MNKKALLKLENGNEIELPILDGNIGPSVLDIKDLYKNTGLFTYDPGFVSTASCASSITFINGEEGTLLYRGYDICKLVEKADFLSVIYLLLYGNLPIQEQYSDFILKVQESSKQVPEQIKHIIKVFPTSAHPMAILMACFSYLAASYHMQHKNNTNNLSFGISAIAQVSIIVAMIYNHITEQEFAEPNTESSYSENFLKMTSGNYNDILTKALDKIFILHADHEQNASTAAVRLSGSTNANLFACIAAGIATLWGSAHGGANEEVINMLEEIKHPDNISKFIARAKDDQDSFKLMGFGHRVYKNYDPRARMLRTVCHEVLNEFSEHDNHLLKIAMQLEEIALHDEYFIQRKLYPNVDFYSGIILKAMGIPTNMFTPLFALARTTGWVAQWYEMVNDKESKIWRPRQLYIGNQKV